MVHEKAPFDIGAIFRDYPLESKTIIGSIISYYMVFKVFGADWFWHQTMQCGFWNGPDYCGGSEWWLLLFITILAAVLTPGIIGGVSLSKKISFTHMTIPERDGLAGLLTGGLFGSLIWAILWLWSLPHTWGMMPFEHGWGWIFMWVFLLLPMGLMPLLAIFFDVVNRFKMAGQYIAGGIEFGQRNLALGMKGDDIRTLQELLNKAGDSILVDGSFGNRTHHAVKTFQSQKGLAVDGIVGPITSDALAELMGDESIGNDGPSLTLSQRDFGSHEAIKVTFNNGPGNPTDWIGIYRRESPIDENNYHENWLYVNGEKIPSEGYRGGEITITHNLQAGDYKVAFLANNGYKLLASEDIMISHDHRSFKEEVTDAVENHEAEATEIEDSTVGESQVEEVWPMEDEIAALAEAVEEISTNPDFDGEISKLRILAEEEMEGQIQNLPAPIQNKIRAGFAAKMDIIEEKGRSKIPDAAKVAAGVGAAAGMVGTAGGLAAVAGVSQRAEVIMEDGEVNLDDIQEQVRDLVEGMDIGEPDFDDEIEEISEAAEETIPEDVVEEIVEPVEEAPTETISEPIIDSMDNVRKNEFIRLAGEVNDANTSSKRMKLISEEMTGEWPVSLVINRIGRTMGIGLEEEYKNGKTIEGKIEGTNLDVSIIASAIKHSNLDELEPGMTISANCVIKEYRAVLKRFELFG